VRGMGPARKTPAPRQSRQKGKQQRQFRPLQQAWCSDPLARPGKPPHPKLGWERQPERQNAAGRKPYRLHCWRAGRILDFHRQVLIPSPDQDEDPRGMLPARSRRSNAGLPCPRLWQAPEQYNVTSGPDAKSPRWEGELRGRARRGRTHWACPLFLIPLMVYAAAGLPLQRKGVLNA
jgi:hypothetical protein